MFAIESSNNKDLIFKCDDENITHHICDLLNKYSEHTTYSVLPDNEIKGFPV
tara:strand:- start:2648 stop:2803 length:156 start_codon:yes stop_codon:yes gene_type:complete